MALLAQNGMLSYDDKIITHWPEFGAGGKERVTIADLLRHEAGLPWFRDPNDANQYVVAADVVVTANSTTKLDKIIEQSPFVGYNGSSRTYHGLTRGAVLDGILRCVDPEHRGVSQFVEGDQTSVGSHQLFRQYPPSKRNNPSTIWPISHTPLACGKSTLSLVPP